MDELDRLYRRMVQNIRANFPDLLSRPFEVSQIYQHVVPYRLNRRELGMETNDDYELALMQLLAGVRGLVTADEELQRALRKELESPNPDLSAFKGYATTLVSLSHEALKAHEQQPVVRRVSGGQDAASPLGVAAHAALAARTTQTLDARPTARAAPPPSATAARPPVDGAPSPPAPVNVERMSPTSRSESAPDDCRYCGGVLPDGRGATFCPHCGHNLTIQHCEACNTELEVGWRFCITCGRQAT